MESLKEAKAHLRKHYKKGVKCPCCDQHVKEYKRKLNSGMALFLIGIYNLDRTYKGIGTPKEFFHNSQILKQIKVRATSLDYSVMKHFGLIESRVSTKGKRDSGYWRLTYWGEVFVTGKVDRPKYVFIYNNKRQGKSDERTTIQKALGDKFDYNELMK